ncbi:MAG: hypothetical protein J0H23_12195 [Micrococcales bacterium]|jgi:hypothetical protein|nr:hypothetical protein [Micrococcales bacterium]OJX69303.1 MAG: hypothetical protein BGO94_12235 [Micrococcales bacterium 72-143]
MATPRYRPEQFVDSGWESGTPERKARFVNSLLRFIADDFPRDRFTRPLYLGLSTHGYFGFIAHYDIHGFYDEQLSTPARRERFLSDLARDCQKDAHLDRPDLWSDVKAVLASRLMQEQEPLRSPRRLAPASSFGAQPTAARPDAPTLF